MSGESAGESSVTPRPIESKSKSRGVRRVSRLIPLVLAGAYVAGGDMPVQQAKLPAPITISGAKPESSQGIKVSPLPIRPTPNPTAGETPLAPTQSPEVADLKSSLEKEYQINIIDATSGDFNKDLQNLAPLLKAIPEDLLQPINGNKYSIALVDSEHVEERFPAGTTVIPENHLTQTEDKFGVEINSAYWDLMGSLIRRKDEMGGFVASGEIMKILGDGFAQKPFFKGNAESPWDQKLREVFIDDKGRPLSPSEIIGNLGQIFTRGHPEFEVIYPVAEYEKVYQVLRERIFGGKDVVENIGGIPQLSNKNVEPGPTPAAPVLTS